MPSTKSPAENSGTTAEKYDGFTAEERAAMKEHAREQKKTAARRGSSRAEKEAAAEQDVLAKIAEMPEADRVLAERIHEIVKTATPDLAPKLWYGMPARQGRQGRLPLPERGEVQVAVRHAGLQRPGGTRRGRDVADRLRPEGADRGRRKLISALVKKAVG